MMIKDNDARTMRDFLPGSRVIRYTSREEIARMLAANRNPCKRKRLVGVLNDDTIPMWRIPTLFSIT
jgi:hypothetical protein